MGPLAGRGAVVEDQVWVQGLGGAFELQRSLGDDVVGGEGDGEQAAEAGIDHLGGADEERPGGLGALAEASVLAGEDGSGQGDGVSVVVGAAVHGGVQVAGVEGTDAVEAHDDGAGVLTRPVGEHGVGGDGAGGGEQEPVQGVVGVELVVAAGDGDPAFDYVEDEDIVNNVAFFKMVRAAETASPCSRDADPASPSHE